MVSARFKHIEFIAHFISNLKLPLMWQEVRVRSRRLGTFALHLLVLCKLLLRCAQSCPTLCGPTDCSPPGFSVHWIFPARIMQWLPFPFPSYIIRVWFMCFKFYILFLLYLFSFLNESELKIFLALRCVLLDKRLGRFPPWLGLEAVHSQAG